MRVYREPDIVPASTWQDLASSDRGHWIVGLLLVAFGGWTISEMDSRTEGISALSVVGFGLTIALVGVAFISRTSAPLQRWGHRHRLLVAVAMVTVFTLTFGPWLVTGLAPVFVLSCVINLPFIPVWFIQRRNASRIAAAMRRARLHDGAEEPARTARTRRPAAPLDVIVLDDADLPPLDGLAPSVTAQANIAGLPPIRTLLLYNFFSKGLSHQAMPAHGWRLHGPVYQLASPIELARAGGFDLAQDEVVGSRLLSTPQQIAALLGRQDERPLAPVASDARPRHGWRRCRDRWQAKARAAVGLAPLDALPEVFSTTGAYPQHVLHCTDGSWKHGVAALCDRCDLVVVDAAEFSAERRGLGWEIQRLIDAVPLSQVVVLVDGFTELPDLVEQFRRAWRDCAEDSPNQAASEPMLLIVAWHGDDKGAWDDDRSPGGRPQAVRDRERLRLHHRILLLLRGEAAPAAMMTPRGLDASEHQPA